MKVIMNPPYDKSLHLKILREVLKHSDDIVNLSPIRWLQDPLAEYKKNSDWKTYVDIRAKIESLDVVPMKDASNIFGAIFNVNLGIYHITKNGGWEGFSVSELEKKVIAKILKSGGLKPVVYTGQAHAVVIKKMTNPNRATAWNLCSNAVGYKNKNSLDDKTQNCIVFKTDDEANNFRAMTETKMYKFCVKTCINNENFVSYYRFFFNAPTYAHPWTDADLYAYFGLTADEIGIIEKEMA